MATHNQQNNGGNGRKQSQVVVVMVPFPAHGHMNQLLHLSRLISSNGFDIPIHYVSTTTYTQKAKSRLQGWGPLSTANIHFHEFQVPYFLPPPPTPRGSVGIPALFQPSIEAAVFLREPVAKLLHSLSPTAERIVVIHDFLVSSTVQDVVSVPNAEAYTFHGVSAFHCLSQFWEIFGKPSLDLDDGTLDCLPTIESAFSPEFVQHINKQLVYVKFNSGNIYDGCRLLEGKYIDLIATKDMVPGLKQWALGPFNPVSVTDDKNSKERHKCLKWLDTQAADSVIYVCFGTTVSLSDEQVQEVAIGLEQSEQKFIWVLRDADREVLYQEEEGSAELPKGYEEKVKGQGMVLRDWAPQLEILAHPSTGGFLSHCGWNSSMESITMGVPIAGWPMHSDQPRNILLTTKGLKVGVVVRDWAVRHQLVTSLRVEKAVRKLMASKEGEEIRKRTVELGGDIRRSMAKGGVTRKELDSFIAHITR